MIPGREGASARRVPDTSGPEPAARRPGEAPEAETVALAPHEIQLLSLLGDGLSLVQVARRSDSSQRTVRRRCRNICDRLGVQTPIQAVVWAARRGLL